MFGSQGSATRCRETTGGRDDELDWDVSPQRIQRPPSRRGYRIEISPQAWQQIGTLPSDVFNRIQQGLEEVAAQPDGRSESDAARPEVLEADGYFARYEVDGEARSVMLLDVTRGRPAAQHRNGEGGSPSHKPTRKKVS